MAMKRRKAPKWTPEQMSGMDVIMPRRVKAASKDPEAQEARSGIVWAKDVPPREIEWLWEPFIPKNMLSVITGREGLGKSYVTVAIAAALSKGEKLPGMEKTPKKMRVLMVNAEDSKDTVLVPRLIAQKANLNHVAFPIELMELDDLGLRRLEKQIVNNKIDVCIIDPIVTFMHAELDIFKANQVNSVLRPLGEIAEKHNCTMILVHHDKKSTMGGYQNSLSGSYAFRSTARAVNQIVERHGVRAFVYNKGNYGPEVGGWNYTIGDNGLEWGEPASEGVAAGAMGGRPKAAWLKARNFLKEILKDGPMPATEALERAEDEKFSKATLNRAKQGLVESFKQGDAWYWKLKGDSAKPPKMAKLKRTAARKTSVPTVDPKADPEIPDPATEALVQEALKRWGDLKTEE